MGGDDKSPDGLEDGFTFDSTPVGTIVIREGISVGVDDWWALGRLVGYMTIDGKRD